MSKAKRKARELAEDDREKVIRTVIGGAWVELPEPPALLEERAFHTTRSGRGVVARLRFS